MWFNLIGKTLIENINGALKQKVWHAQRKKEVARNTEIEYQKLFKRKKRLLESGGSFKDFFRTYSCLFKVLV